MFCPFLSHLSNNNRAVFSVFCSFTKFFSYITNFLNGFPAFFFKIFIICKVSFFDSASSKMADRCITLSGERGFVCLTYTYTLAYILRFVEHCVIITDEIQ